MVHRYFSSSFFHNRASHPSLEKSEGWGAQFIGQTRMRHPVHRLGTRPARSLRRRRRADDRPAGVLARRPRRFPAQMSARGHGLDCEDQWTYMHT
jgi:hypothetical protein